jgi:hypothetical protein
MISRTALITSSAIAAVVVAGSFAMGANLGLIGGTEDPAGAGQLDLSEVQAAPAASEASAGADASMSSWSMQDYDVDGAGIVSLRWREGTLEVARAQAATGWTATVEPSGSAESAAVSFTDGAGTVYRFTAQLHPDGSVQAAVDVPGASGGSGDGEGDDDEEHEEHEGDSHEGREDSDHEAREHEYEGGEDDD